MSSLLSACSARVSFSLRLLSYFFVFCIFIILIFLCEAHEMKTTEMKNTKKFFHKLPKLPIVPPHDSSRCSARLRNRTIPRRFLSRKSCSFAYFSTSFLWFSSRTIQKILEVMLTVFRNSDHADLHLLVSKSRNGRGGHDSSLRRIGTQTVTSTDSL